MKRNRIQLSPTRAAALHSRPPLERMMRMHERLKRVVTPIAENLRMNSKSVQKRSNATLISCATGWVSRSNMISFTSASITPNRLRAFQMSKFPKANWWRSTSGRKLWRSTRALRLRLRFQPLFGRSPMGCATQFPLPGATWIQRFLFGVRDDRRLTFIFSNS